MGTASVGITSRTREGNALYAAFLGVLIVCFTPLKPVGYLLPWGFTLWLAMTTPQLISRSRMSALVAILAVLPVIYAVISDEFLYANYIIAALTYSSIVPIVALRTEQLASRQLLERIVSVVVTMIAIQGAVGIAQALYGAFEGGTFAESNGDRVQGTIYPFLSAEGRGANPMFAVNMALMLLGVLSRPDLLTRRRRIILLVGAVSLALASVMHVLIYMVVAIAMALLLARPVGQAPERRAGAATKYVLSLALVLSGVGYFALRSNFEIVDSVVESFADLEAGLSPRTVMLWSVATELPQEQPQQPLVGLGPGQFTSRASLIASGLYLGGPDNPKGVPLLDPQATQLAQRYCFSLMASYADKIEWIGSSQQPFFSVLSIYTELGLVGLAVIGYFVVRLLITLRRRVRSRPDVRPLVLSLVASTLFVVLLGLQENYWEMPQAILVGVLMMKVIYANAMSGRLPADGEQVGGPLASRDTE